MLGHGCPTQRFLDCTPAPLPTWPRDVVCLPTVLSSAYDSEVRLVEHGSTTRDGMDVVDGEVSAWVCCVAEIAGAPVAVLADVLAEEALPQLAVLDGVQVRPLLVVSPVLGGGAAGAEATLAVALVDAAALRAGRASTGFRSGGLRRARS